jgi:spoIIIJ-associated protein
LYSEGFAQKARLMNKNQEIQNIENRLKDLLSKMGVSYESVVIEDDGIGITRFNVVSKCDARTLIGLRGEHLQALNALVKQMGKPIGTTEAEQYIVDVNNYQKTQIEHLRNQTKIIAERAKLFKKEMALPAMSAYERMIVHSVAKTIEGVETRSEGEGKERCVVVCPLLNAPI